MVNPLLHMNKAADFMLYLKRELGLLVRTHAEHVEVLNCTKNSVAIRLYNLGKRPTTYQILVNPDKLGWASSLTIDTIINEMKPAHQSLKTNSIYAGFVINKAKELMAQPCDGNKRETLKNFEPLGLLYRKREDADLSP
ncbi:hypothetical protein D3C79_35120 [compost metagenome]